MKVIHWMRVLVAAMLICLVLLPFSIVKSKDSKLSKYDVLGFASKANQWIEDTSDKCEEISRTLYYKVTGLSPITSLSIGKEGWIYYTRNDNLDIAKGTYPLTPEQLDYQASAFSNLNKYYEGIGADFYYLPYPSKTAIYPEYMHDVTLPIGDTPVDIITDNLHENTDVNVILAKQQMLTDKDRGQLYMKGDVHSSDLGSYSTYKAICSEFTAEGKITMNPIDVSFADGEYAVGSNKIVGIAGLFGDVDIAPVAHYEAHAHRVTEGALYNELQDYIVNSEYLTNMSSWAMYENNTVDTGTLMIYGTSMFMSDDINDEGWQLVRYLAENFSRVVYIGIWAPIQPELDAIVRPDYVILETPERYSNSAGYHDTPLVPIFSSEEDYASLPEKGEDIELLGGGLSLNWFNEQNITPGVTCEINGAKSINLMGWAADPITQQPLSALYLKIGEFVFQCEYGINSPGLADALGLPAENDKAAFSIKIPSLFLKDVDKLDFIAVGTDGSYRYSPVCYQVVD